MGNMMLTLSVARCLETILIIDLRWYDCRVDPPAYSKMNISLIKYISFASKNSNGNDLIRFKKENCNYLLSSYILG